MERDVFDIIEEYYMNGSEALTTAAEEAFYRDLIDPVHEQNSKLGSEFEDRFLKALDAVGIQNFKNGFKSGIRFLLECMSK